MAILFSFNPDGALKGVVRNDELSYEELLAIKQQDGVLCMEGDAAAYMRYEEGMDIALRDGVLHFYEGDRLRARAEERLRTLTEEVGALAQRRAGKAEIGLPTTEEDALIAALKAEAVTLIS